MAAGADHRRGFDFPPTWLGVEVLCESSLGTRALFRVVGASVTSPLDACLRQPLEPPVDLTGLTASGEGQGRVKPYAVDHASLGGWPVALDEKAAFGITSTEKGPSGLLRWRPLALPPRPSTRRRP